MFKSFNLPNSILADICLSAVNFSMILLKYNFAWLELEKK